MKFHGYTMYPIIILCMIIISRGQTTEIIWSHQMNVASSDWSGIYSLIRSGGANCPNLNGKDYCWDLSSQTLVWPQSIGSSLQNYSSIELTYSLSSSGVSTTKYCAIEYSANASAFTDLFRTTGSDIAPSQHNDQTFTFGNSASLSIRLTASGANTHCYFNDFSICGTMTPSASPKSPMHMRRLLSTYNVLPFTYGDVATVYQLTMSYSGNVITFSSGDELFFVDPGVGTVITLTMTFNYDSTGDIYCPGCVRQVLSNVDNVDRACISYYNTIASDVTLSVTYTSDGSSRNINMDIDLQYGCSDSTWVPNSVIGYILATPDPTAAPTATPTIAPTAAPTVAPTPNKPTPSPTDSANMVFVSKDGCDCNDHCKDAGPTAACLTIEFAYDCLIGNNGCDSQGNDGNGNIYLDSGEWVWPTQLIYDNEQIVIHGNGVNETTLYYDTASFIGCTWYKCWLEIRDLTISSDPNTENVDPIQIHMYQGGTLVFRNVLFNGDNYNTNQNGNPFWILEDERVSAIFIECVFENNDIMCHISDGASLQFIDCVFKDNVITQSSAAFVVQHAVVTFDRCSFYNNSQTNGAFIDVWNSTLNVRDCTFRDNEIDILMNVTGDTVFNTFRCLNASESLVMLDANSFISNQFNTLIAITSSSMHAAGDIFDDNACHDYCIQSTDSSISIDLQSLYQYQNNLNFVAFDRLPSSSNLSISCIDGSDTMEITKYLSFDDHINSSNTKLIFNDCVDPFSVSYLNVSSVRLSAFEQVYLNDIAGGAVLDTFTCDDNTATCGIVCNNSVSCFSSTFVINTMNANIHCGSHFACGYTTINRTQLPQMNTTNNNSLHIVCDDEASCLRSTINVDQLALFVLHCVQTDSCSDMTVNIENTITSSIICHHVGACDALSIHTDSDNTTLTLYEYSQGILLDTPSGFTGYNLICDPNHA
eukprot:743247_1